MAAYAPKALKRFFKTVTVEKGDGGYSVLLDGKPMRTPQKKPLIVPFNALAEGIKEEWASQGAEIALEQMPLTQFACAAIDYTMDYRKDVEEETLAFAGTDLLCYRAEEPEVLIQRQKDAWDGWLQWAKDNYGVELALTQGIMPVEQAPEVFTRLRGEVEVLDAFHLTALWLMAKHTTSFILALAVLKGSLAGEQAFLLSRVDEFFQNEKWGEDEEALERRETAGREMFAIGEFLALLK